MTRHIAILVAFLVSTSAACGDDDPVAGAPDAGGSDEVQFTVGVVANGPVDMGDVAGATVELYDAADLSAPLAAGTTGADGHATIELVPPQGLYVVHVSKAGAHDTWFWSIIAIEDDLSFDNVPLSSDADWSAGAQAMNVTLDAAQGIVLVRAFTDGGARLAPMTASTDAGGEVIYVADGVPDPGRTSSPDGEAVIVNVDAGGVELSVTNGSIGATRDITLYADALNAVLVNASSL